MRRRNSTLRALPLLLVLAAAVPASAPIGFDLRHDRLFVPAEIAGRPVEALLDSGAEMSIVDVAFAHELKLADGRAETVKGSGGAAAGTIVPDVRVRVGSFVMPPQPVFVTDLGDVARRLNGGKPIPAVLGRPFFDGGRWSIDFATRQITPGADAPAGVSLPLTTNKGVETFPAMVEGHAARALLDLGNGNDVLVAEPLARELGLLTPARIVGRASGGGLGGGVERAHVVLKTLRLGNVTLRNVPAAIDPTPNAEEVNVGTRVLAHFHLTTDFAAHRLWLAPR